MANYSKDMERQNKALKDLMSGKEYEKEYVQVGYEGKQENLGGKTRKSELTDTMASVRMPWFCPNCEKVMKRRLDEKMWYLYEHCFDCQITEENKLRISGKYDAWAEKKVIANKLSWIRDQKQQLKEFKSQKAPDVYNQVNPDGHSIDKEKWSVDFEKLKKQATEALEHLQKVEDSLL